MAPRNRKQADKEGSGDDVLQPARHRSVKQTAEPAEAASGLAEEEVEAPRTAAAQKRGKSKKARKDKKQAFFDDFDDEPTAPPARATPGASEDEEEVDWSQKKKEKAAKKKGGSAFAALEVEDDEVAAEVAEEPDSPGPGERLSPEPEQPAIVLPAKKRGKGKKGKKGTLDHELFPDDYVDAEQPKAASTGGEGDLDGENVEAQFGKKKKKEKKDTVRKAISVNAFDILNAEGAAEGDVCSEGKEAEGAFETPDAPAANRLGIQSLSSDEEETPGVEIKGKKKPKESRESRKERKKKAKETDATAADKNEPEGPTDENAKYGNSNFERSQAAAYGYASGQPLGPEGTNPADAIAVTGNLISAQNSRDLQVDKVTIQAFGKLLIKESELNLINGRRYGLIAPNGSGKSTLLHAIACGLMPMPRVLDVYLLDREYIPTETTGELTSLEAVLEIVEREKIHLGKEMEELYSNVDLHAVRIDAIQTRLTELEAEGADRLALSILQGLGFTETLINTKTKDLSGGWRMRISLARILFVRPTLIMLDEPTNHLDLNAVVWLEEYLTHNLDGHTLVITSHSQDTLNEVCTDIIHLYHQHLDYYSGNYDNFVKVRAEKDALLKKRARAQDKQMAKIKDQLGKTGSKQQAQAKSKVRAMEKRQEKEKEKDKTLQEEIINEKELNIQFEKCNGGIPSPALKFRDVLFTYPGQPEPIFEDLNFGIDLSSRIALVGPNGAGKSTLLKLMLGRLEPTEGEISRHHHLRMAHFHQHMGDQLDMDMSAVRWLQSHFPDRKDHEMRQFVGRYGLTGKQQVIPMRQLSDGQRRRVIFAYLGLRNPHIIFMDEPTNALDLETIDALAEAINEFDGGVVFVTHDFRLIDQVADEIWNVNDRTAEVFDGDIRDYKNMLKERIREQREADENAKV